MKKMISNELSLGLSMKSNKGVFAVFLGSGVSYSAGIKTGWGIVEELCMQLQFIEEGQENTLNPIDWYEKTYGELPRYDVILELLGKTTSERNAILERYFIPTKEEAEDGIKTPTKAHRSIAKLVKKGYIKVILTTNFDRLMEHALDEEHVNYQVLHDESGINGMKPYVHSECTVIKINGDFKDIRFKNIEAELSLYPERVVELLESIFEEFGLIISGWSADWDTALKTIIKSVKSRRYSWYWHSLKAEVTSGGRELIGHREASLIVDSDGADSFFSKLLDNVEAIEKLEIVNDLDYNTVIAKVKSYISTDREIDLQDLIMHEVKRIKEFILSVSVNDRSLFEEEKLFSILKLYEQETKNLAGIIATISYYGKKKFYQDLIISTLQSLTDNFHSSGGFEELVDTQQLPLSIVLYASGIGAVLKKDYDQLNNIFVEPIIQNDLYRGRNISFVEISTPIKPLTNQLKRTTQYERKYLPASDYMFEIMEPIFNHLVFSTKEYDYSFDIFEFLLSLKVTYVGEFFNFIGRFAYKYDDIVLRNFLSNGKKIGINWPVLALFDADAERFEESLRKLSEIFKQASYGGKDYSSYYQINKGN
ncbi:SIR2 family protein [Brevibacterium sp. PAMC23299]|nr:SIR2 family protein [Brevibacterium sp. PAMC23299]